MPGSHSLLSPSSSHRWLHCTAAPRLEAEEPKKDTDYTLEGTLAHAYCAKELKAMIGLPFDEEDKVIEQLRDKYLTDEMLGHVSTYVSIVGEKFSKAKIKVKDSQLIVERRLGFSHWIPDPNGSFGTGDAIIITDGTLEIIDFKYGKGVEVSSRWNSQMMIYALGAIDEFADEYNIQRVRMTIIQPRLENLSEFEIPASALVWWAESVLSPKAKEALSANGRQECGDWCRFCAVRCRCVKLADDCLSIASEFSGKESISDEEMAKKVLPNLPMVKQWASAMEEYATEKAVSGTHYDGYKLVEGRSLRKVVDPQALGRKLRGAGLTDIYKPLELKSITDLEKVVGKKEFAELAGDTVVKPQGRPTLVPDSDKRPAITAGQDFDAFAETA